MNLDAAALRLAGLSPDRAELEAAKISGELALDLARRWPKAPPETAERYAAVFVAQAAKRARTAWPAASLAGRRPQ